MKRNYLFLFVFLAGALLYVNTLPNKYAYDDFSVIEGNKFTKEGITGAFGHVLNDSFTGFTGKKNLFRGGRYRPLSLITFSIEYQFFGKTPFISHLVNILIYGLICVLLLKVLAALFKERLVFSKFRDYFLSLSLMATLIFAAHPIHTEVTANIKGRDELMALLFGLLAWNSLIVFTDKSKPLHALYAGIFFFLSLMAKESAAPFLLLIPVSVFCFRSQVVFRKSILYTSLSLFIGFFLFIMIRQSILGWGSKPSMEDNIISNSFMHANGISERYGTTFYTLWLYVKLLFFPHPLTIDYYPFYIPYVGLTDIRSILPMCLYALLTVAAVFYTYKKNIAGYGLFFYLVALFPVSNLLFIIGPFMGERFLFIPSVGFAIALAWIMIKGAEKLKLNQGLPYVFMVVFLLFSVKTISRNFDWKDNFTLYTKDVQTSANSAVITKGAGHEYLLKAEVTGDTLAKREYARNAIFYLEQAMKLNKSTTEVFLLANSYYEHGDYSSTLGLYLKTLELDPDYQKAYFNYFVVLARLSSPTLRISYCDSLIGIVGNKYEPCYHKGLIFGKELNMLDSSIVYLLKAYSADSMKVECLGDLGVAFAMKGDFPKSIKYLSKALISNPSDEKARNNLAASLYRSGDKTKAQMVAEKRWP
jgi:tetratricopeptide (TPR) repeat protein